MEERRIITVIKLEGEFLLEGKSILQWVQIIKDYEGRQSLVVVCSSIRKATSLLISIFQKCQKGELKKAEKDIQKLYKVHKQIIINMKLSSENTRLACRGLEGLLEKLYMRLCKSCKFLSADYAFVISFGDRFANLLFVVALKESGIKGMSFEGSDIIVASNNFAQAKAFKSRTEKKSREVLYALLDQGVVPVISGAFASNKGGKVVTLGGSDDYGAVVIARALNADDIIFLREISGVLRKKSFIRFKNVFGAGL